MNISIKVILALVLNSPSSVMCLHNLKGSWGDH